MNVGIITIGDELLIGQVVDTNSSWMAKALNDSGFQVVCKATVGDSPQDIAGVIDEVRRKASVILITGGLGPTKDDVTMTTLCRYFNSTLVFSREVHANIKALFSRNKHIMNELTCDQAMVPEKAIVVQNQVGTAPCTWFEEEQAVFVSIPGVPHEMKWLMTNEIIPRLKNKYHSNLCIKHYTFLVSGYAESTLAIELEDFEKKLPAFVKLAYLPQPGMVRLRLSAHHEDEKDAIETLSILKKQLKTILGDHILAEEDKNIETLIGEQLRLKELTLGTAESCTGGAIAALITSVPGSSDYFRGSIIAYSNAVKQNVLSVSEKDLELHGAVSKQVVEQMARGALNVLECDYTVATSGIAGPDGGTVEKPVGTACIAVANKDEVFSEEYHFSRMREHNIQRTVNMALLMLLKELNK